MRFSKSKPKNLVTLSANYIVEPKQTKTWNKKTRGCAKKATTHKINPIHNKNSPLKSHISTLHEGRTKNTTQRQRAQLKKHLYLTICELDETLLTLI